MAVLGGAAMTKFFTEHGETADNVVSEMLKNVEAGLFCDYTTNLRHIDILISVAIISDCGFCGQFS